MGADTYRQCGHQGRSALPAHRRGLTRATIMIVDTHAHLDMLADPISALRNAGVAGVDLICTVVNVLEEPERTFEQLESWREAAGPDAPQVRIIVGTHPHDAARTDRTAMEKVRSYARDPRVVGLGE
ncbi:MAG: TatD family hydrolase, partial [Coriobacteriia bacterium]|nr:TatD family hydrolase [Coriobacteriia bacterium]